MQIEELLRIMVEKGASDLHLKVPKPPVLRINGILSSQEDQSSMNSKDIDSIFEKITTEKQSSTFQESHELDFSYSVTGLGRFRVNIMQQRGTKSMAFRYIPHNTPTIDKLGLPQSLKKIILKTKGLFLITGPTGSGKSTTLAALINHLNENVNRNIITVEDPIEFLQRDIKSIIRQRDIGDDTVSFPIALTNALRHDVDVIVLGEMRDLDTISTAITAAETGHLVLATLHTNNAEQTIDRIIDVFPNNHQLQVRQQLSKVIGAVTSQVLIPLIGGGQTAVFEIMVNNGTIGKLIREEKMHELHLFLDQCRDMGMQSMNSALAQLVKNNQVTQDEAIQKSYEVSGLNKMLSPSQYNL